MHRIVTRLLKGKFNDHFEVSETMVAEFDGFDTVVAPRILNIACGKCADSEGLFQF